MNYQKIYDNIILKAKGSNRLKGDGNYYERHHILPKSLGGPDTKENLVLLTAKEHYICHMLLIKIYQNDSGSYIKCLRAFMMMKPKHYHNRPFSSRQFDKIRNVLYGENGLSVGKNHQCYGQKRSDETRKKQSDSAKLVSQSEEGRERRKQLALSKSPEEREIIRQKILGQKRTDEQRENISKAHRGQKMNELHHYSKPVSINGRIYPSASEAVRQIQPKITNIGYRLTSKSKKFKDWFYVDEKGVDT